MQLSEMTRQALQAIDNRAAHINLPAAVLLEQALHKQEGTLTEDGALAVLTGEHTGRSAADKFVVKDAHTQDTVWWGPNAPMSPEHFDTLLEDFVAQAQGLELQRQDLIGGADAKYAVQSRIYLEYSWHALFIQYLLRAPSAEQSAAFDPDLTIITLPSFRADPARHSTRSETVVALDLSRRIVLIGGTSYAGETKKSVFSFLNYMLPEQGVMPM
ncbi:MAG: phosphoenolpyruvate carboxykinase (ATP), partial [Pseudomonadota bacterium]